MDYLGFFLCATRPLELLHSIQFLYFHFSDGKEPVTKPLFQHWVEEAMHRLFLPLPLLGDQSAKYLRQYDFNHVLTDNEIKT